MTILVVGDLAQFAQWAQVRTYKNIEASRLVGALLPPGTLVHGKLANGLSLENRIRPVFVGRASATMTTGSIETMCATCSPT